MFKPYYWINYNKSVIFSPFYEKIRHPCPPETLSSFLIDFRCCIFINSIFRILCTSDSFTRRENDFVFAQVYVAIYDYAAADDDEITINEGDRMGDVTIIDEGWMEGLNTRTGKYGMFPANYVQAVWRIRVKHFSAWANNAAILTDFFLWNNWSLCLDLRF